MKTKEEYVVKQKGCGNLVYIKAYAGNFASVKTVAGSLQERRITIRFPIGFEGLENSSKGQ